MGQIYEMLLFAGIGILGGLLKVIISSLKRVALREKIAWNVFWLYFLVIVSVSGFTGIVLSTAGKIVSFIGGYAALDLVGSFGKSFMKTKFKKSNSQNEKTKNN